MKNILAENLLRFGVKNLSDSDLYRISQSKLLKEEISKVLNLPNYPTTVFTADSDFNEAADMIKSWIAQNKLTFNTPDAHVWLVFYILISEGRSGWAEKWAKVSKQGNVNKILELCKSVTMVDVVRNVLSNAVSGRVEIQMNEHPDQKGMVLTAGVIKPNSFTQGDPNGASNIREIVTFLNDHNLTNALANPLGTNGIDIEPYKIGRESRKIFNTGTDAFVPGLPGKDPGAGALDLVNADYQYNYDAKFYSIGKFDAASAKSTGTQPTTIIFTPGEELTANLGKQLFKTGTITPESDMAAKVKEAVDGAKKIGTITAVRIESGASFDRPVNADNATFAKMVGMPTNKVPANPKVDKQGTVTDPMSGGNAFLAHYRGIAIQNALGNQAGVTPTMVAKVEKGGDAAQYARIAFTVKKPDGTNTITNDDIKSIGKGSVSSDLSGIFKVVKYDL